MDPRQVEGVGKTNPCVLLTRKAFFVEAAACEPATWSLDAIEDRLARLDGGNNAIEAKAAE